MDLNSIVFAGLFIVLGGLFLVFSVSFIAYKVSNKQTSKVPIQNFQTQQYHQPKPAPVQYLKVPVQQYQQMQYEYNFKQQPVQNLRPVSPFQVYTN